jgi:hypothetical protein
MVSIVRFKKCNKPFLISHFTLVQQLHWTNRPPLTHNLKKPTIQTTNFDENASLGSQDSSPKLDELTHQQESIDHSNTTHEEPHANGAFIHLPTTSNTIKGENLAGLIKIDPSPKPSLFEKNIVGLSFSRQLFDKLSGSFEASICTSLQLNGIFLAI